MWKIIEQEETVGKMTMTVECKSLRFFPCETPGFETVFKPLAFPVLQIIVQDERGNRFKLKCSTADGVTAPTFTFQHPDKMDHPTMVVGQGKSRRAVPDFLAPKEKKQGEKERYGTVQAFRERIKFLGPELVEKVLLLFAQRLVQLEQKRLSKKSKKKAA